MLVVNPNGTVTRCYQIGEVMGNIYHEIKFDKKLRTCPVNFCACPLKSYGTISF